MGRRSYSAIGVGESITNSHIFNSKGDVDYED